MKFTPFFILTLALTSVASTISPFELSPGFYRIGYVLPAHEIYQVLLDIWTRGCNPTLYRSLPILFSWWLVGILAFLAATRRRVLLASAESRMTSLGARTVGERDEEELLSLQTSKSRVSTP